MPARPQPVADLAGVSITTERRGDVTELELVGVDALAAEPDVVDELVRAARRAMARPEVQGSVVHLAATHPAEAFAPVPEAVADALGLPHRRDLLQLRRTLPVPPDHPSRATAPPLALRPIDLVAPSGDAAAWLRVNNRAFATHPDQGAETPETLAARTAEPWFDPAGFLVADDTDRPGELAGFCWTKVHPATVGEPEELGEIYVIGVDPSHQGQGLGPALVLAGLDHLAGLGVTTAVLYVEADNGPALTLYDRLGFAVHQRRRVYST